MSFAPDSQPLLKKEKVIKYNRLYKTDDGSFELTETKTVPMVLLIIGLIFLLPVPFYCLGICLLIYVIFFYKIRRTKFMFAKQKVLLFHDSVVPCFPSKLDKEIMYGEIDSISFIRNTNLKIIDEDEGQIFIKLKKDDKKVLIFRMETISKVKQQATALTEMLQKQFTELNN